MSKWVITSKRGQALTVLRTINANKGQFIHASGSTVEIGDYEDGPVRMYHTTWAASLLGHTQVKDNKGGTAPATRRLAEFVLDYVGAIKYGKAKPRQYTKK